MGMLSVMTLLLISIWTSSYSILRRGTSRLSSTQQAREVVRRTIPIVMSAISPSETHEAISSPLEGESADHLDFYSADNLMEPMESISPRSIQFYRFMIYLEADRTVRIQELDLVSGLPNGKDKILASNVEEIRFDRLAVNVVRFRAFTTETIRNASNQEEELKVERSAVISIPFYSSVR